MIHELASPPTAPFTWLDVVAPTNEEVSLLASRYHLTEAYFAGCLDPEHMPKSEKVGNHLSIVLRAYDPAARPEHLTSQQLTRKIVLVVEQGLLITVHRTEMPFFDAIKHTYAQKSLGKDAQYLLIRDIIRGVIDTFDAPMNRLTEDLGNLETVTFRDDGEESLLEDGYYLRRKASVVRHILGLTNDLLAGLPDQLPRSAIFKHAREKCDRHYFYVNEIIDSTDKLLSLHLALLAQKTNHASHKTNEVMRLLTVFSAFFLPLNFIASIYGMNFEHMPELKKPLAYPATLGVMALVAIGIFSWFRSRGWLRRE